MTSPDAEIAKSRREILDRHPSPAVKVKKSFFGLPCRGNWEYRYEIVFPSNRVYGSEKDARLEGRSVLSQIQEALRGNK